MTAELLSILREMRHSPVRNYVIPGLTSWMVGAKSGCGLVRLFESEREHQEVITPHSHRFNFHCLVLAGTVTNRVWTEGHGDLFIRSVLHYYGQIGQYTKIPEAEPTRWGFEDQHFEAGETYGLLAHEVHSIYFSRGAEVLFFEGPVFTNESIIIEPYVNGERIPVMKTEEWMFRRD